MMNNNLKQLKRPGCEIRKTTTWPRTFLMTFGDRATDLNKIVFSSTRKTIQGTLGEQHMSLIGRPSKNVDEAKTFSSTVRDKI